MKRKILLLLGSAATAVAAFGVADPAGADWPRSQPIVYNHNGGDVPVCGGPGDESGAVITEWLQNSEEVQLNCWVDHDESGENYRTVRWFHVTSFDEGKQGYVNASWVYYQDAQPDAPRCGDGFYTG